MQQAQASQPALHQEEAADVLHRASAAEASSLEAARHRLQDHRAQLNAREVSHPKTSQCHQAPAHTGMRLPRLAHQSRNAWSEIQLGAAHQAVSGACSAGALNHAFLACFSKSRALDEMDTTVQAALAQTATQLEETRAKLTQQGEELQRAQREVFPVAVNLACPALYPAPSVP